MRHAGSQGGECILDARVGLGRLDHAVGCLAELLEVTTAVNQLVLHLKAARNAEPVDGRGNQHATARLGPLRHHLGQLGLDAGQVFAFATVFPVLEHDVDQTAVGQGRIARQHRVAVEGRHPTEADRVQHARHLEGRVDHLLEHMLGALEGCGVGQLHGHHHIALVFDRQEIGGHTAEAVTGSSDQDDAERRRTQPLAQQRANQAQIRRLGLGKHAVEHARERVGPSVGVLRPQVLRRLGGLERDGVDA